MKIKCVKCKREVNIDEEVCPYCGFSVQGYSNNFLLLYVLLLPFSALLFFVAFANSLPYMLYLFILIFEGFFFVVYFVLMVVFVDRIEYKRLIYKIGIIFSVLMMIITNESARWLFLEFYDNPKYNIFEVAVSVLVGSILSISVNKKKNKFLRVIKYPVGLGAFIGIVIGRVVISHVSDDNIPFIVCGILDILTATYAFLITYLFIKNILNNRKG